MFVHIQNSQNSKANIALDTDFTDYYDYLFTAQRASCELAKGVTDIVYRRKMTDRLNKDVSLDTLRKLGIQTIETMPVQRIAGLQHVVVYTDLTQHTEESKLLLSADEARLMFPNSLASIFRSEAEGLVCKLLNVGSLRYKIILQDDTKSLKQGKVVQVSSLPPAYYPQLGLPIFSIDYIPTSDGLLAITLNTVEKLDSYGFQSILPPEIVKAEVYNALLKYNKI